VLAQEPWEQCAAFDASVVLIEDKASGTQLIQELVADGLHAVTRYQPQSDKIMRMHAQTAMIENGFVHLPTEAAWLAEYLHELTAFPKGRHDDQVDSTAQMLDWFKQAGSGPTTNAGIYQLYKELAEQARAQTRSRTANPVRQPPLHSFSQSSTPVPRGKAIGVGALIQPRPTRRRG